MGLEHEISGKLRLRKARARALVVRGAVACAVVAAALGALLFHGRATSVAHAAPPADAWGPARVAHAPAPPTRALPALPIFREAPPVVVGTFVDSHGVIQGGALSAEATFGTSKLFRGGPGEELLHVSIDGVESSGRAEPRPIDFALVLDVSGSMEEENKIVLLKRATNELLSKLGPLDRAAIVAFSNDARTVFPLATLDDARRRAYAAAVDALEAGGGTNISAGLLAGADELRKAEARPGSARRIVLMTDGLANFGVQEPGELAKLVSGLAREGATISTIGLGLDYGEKLLADLADAGGGSFHDASTGDKLARIYEHEVQATRALVARDASLVIEPAPGVVVEQVFLWPASDGKAGEKVVSLGDVSGGRHLKAVARLRVPTSGQDANVPVARVSLRYDDVRGKKAERVASRTVALGVALEKDEQVAQASAALAIQGDLSHVVMTEAVQRAHDLAVAGNYTAAQQVFFEVEKTNGSAVLNWTASDGTMDYVDVHALALSFQPAPNPCAPTTVAAVGSCAPCEASLDATQNARLKQLQALVNAK